MSNKLSQGGLFWEPTAYQEKGNSRRPEPVWLRPDYLPGLEEAKAMRGVLFMTRDEFIKRCVDGETMICDVETYPNYFLAAFMSYNTGRVYYFEAAGVESTTPDFATMRRGLLNAKIITFNGIRFDFPVLAVACDGAKVNEIKRTADALILGGESHWMLLQRLKIEPLESNHVDLIEVCPLSASLKIYGGRIHAPQMQDLPFPPHDELSPDQISIIRHYCCNDLQTTAWLFSQIQAQMAIRVEMSALYGVDLRSKSDAQIAEAVIKSEIENLNGNKPEPPQILAGTAYKYTPPQYLLNFRLPQLRELLADIEQAHFVVGDSGSIGMPDELKGRKVRIGSATYSLGIGGLHSNEKGRAVIRRPGWRLVDRDVASYYPAIILNQSLCPPHLGLDFSVIYRRIVERRLGAKRSGNSTESDMLKIVINGSFGKFGSPYSALYAPDLLIQVTITGQLSLLYLIEKLHLSGIETVSANTDGIVFRYHEEMAQRSLRIVSEWEKETGFETEETEYSALYSRDVNNYVAVKPDGKFKGKGAYSNPWGDPTAAIFRFHKNPVNTICVEAATKFLTEGVPVSLTIRKCKDVKKFVTVRKVKGGGVWKGEFLGRAVRYYWSEDGGEIIQYAESGNKVPDSEGCRPCLRLPSGIPQDLDFDRYERQALRILADIGALPMF